MEQGKAVDGLSLNELKPPSPDISSPLVVPPGPLTFSAPASDMSVVEELKLLKAQVSDVARVCNAVARGDLEQRITVPVWGTVMTQVKDVVNTMVCAEVSACFDFKERARRSTDWDSLQVKWPVCHRKSGQEGASAERFITHS